MSRYFYDKEYLENLADRANAKFYPERLEKIMEFDPYDFLEKLGLEVEWKYISPNDKVLGLVFFEDGYWYVWPNGDFKKDDKPIKERFKKGTVVNNQVLLDNKKLKPKEVFVCNHENCHWIKDKAYFKENSTEIVKICSDDSMNGTYWNDSMSELDIIERQTNYLNAAILMPREVLKKEFFKKLRYKNIPEKPIEYQTYMKGAISGIAKGYGLNYNVVLYRLYDLNILKRK